MTGPEIGTQRVSEEQVTELIRAMQLIEPYCSPDTYADGLDSVSYSYDADDIKTEFVVYSADPDLQSVDEVDAGLGSSKIYRLMRTEITQEVSGICIETVRDYSISLYDDGTPIEAEPVITNDFYVSSDSGINWERSRNLVQQKSLELIKMLGAKKDDGKEDPERDQEIDRLNAEISDLQAKDHEFERAMGSSTEYNQAEHVKLMGYVHAIYEWLGIEPEAE